MNHELLCRTMKSWSVAVSAHWLDLETKLIADDALVLESEVVPPKLTSLPTWASSASFTAARFTSPKFTRVLSSTIISDRSIFQTWRSFWAYTDLYCFCHGFRLFTIRPPGFSTWYCTTSTSILHLYFIARSGLFTAVSRYITDIYSTEIYLQKWTKSMYMHLLWTWLKQHNVANLRYPDVCDVVVVYNVHREQLAVWHVHTSRCIILFHVLM